MINHGTGSDHRARPYRDARENNRTRPNACAGAYENNPESTRKNSVGIEAFFPDLGPHIVADNRARSDEHVVSDHRARIDRRPMTHATAIA